MRSLQEFVQVVLSLQSCAFRGIGFVEVVLSLQSCAFLRGPLEVGWLTDRLAGDLLEIQKACFFQWSNGF